MERRKCKINPNKFCYICGRYMFANQSQTITYFVKKYFYYYFGIKLGDQDKSWAPHKVCISCVSTLRNWSMGRKISFSFGVPMVWRESKNHINDCYFCISNVKGFNRGNKKYMTYPDLESARRPIPHGIDIPVPELPKHINLENNETGSGSEFSVDESSCVNIIDTPQTFTQAELNDLVRDLNLTKDAAEILASRLHEKRLLSPGTLVTFYRNRQKELEQYYNQDDSITYCVDIAAVMSKLRVNYEPNEWRLFIDSSKRSLKGVLLHNGNNLSSIPVAYSVNLKENYDNLERVLNKLNYKEHNWTICGDFKVIGILLGQQQGNTKYPCYICEWDSRDRENHWTRQEWPRRTNWKPLSMNIMRNSLVNPDKILLPPLHIKLGLMKQLTKALDKSGNCFQYLTTKFPSLTNSKIKEGIFNGPQIRELFKDVLFEDCMNIQEKGAWVGFKEVVNNFLGNKKSECHVEIVTNMLRKYEVLGCNMSLKLHFLHSHLDHFPANLGAVSEEQGERFHQDIQKMESRYQGKSSIAMLSDYVWMLQYDEPGRAHNRTSRTRTVPS